VIYIYIKTSIQRNILTIRQNTSLIVKHVGLSIYLQPCTYKLLSVTSAYQETTDLNTKWSKFSVHLTIRAQTQCIRRIRTQLNSWRWSSQNTFGMWTVLYWTRSSRTQFGVSINVWRLAVDTLNITRKFMYCDHQVRRDFLITLYVKFRGLEILLRLITF